MKVFNKIYVKDVEFYYLFDSKKLEVMHASYMLNKVSYHKKKV